MNMEHSEEKEILKQGGMIPGPDAADMLGFRRDQPNQLENYLKKRGVYSLKTVGTRGKKNITHSFYKKQEIEEQVLLARFVAEAGPDPRPNPPPPGYANKDNGFGSSSVQKSRLPAPASKPASAPVSSTDIGEKFLERIRGISGSQKQRLNRLERILDGAVLTKTLPSLSGHPDEATIMEWFSEFELALARLDKFTDTLQNGNAS